MNVLTQADLTPSAEYERTRDSFRSRIIKLKGRRRIAVGDRVTLVFENRDTIQFQVQEMVRAERIHDPVKVQEELDVYNALIPVPGELSATLFIEITESAHIKEALDAFQGIDRGERVALQAGPHLVYGLFEGGRSKEDKISAVHFVRFRPRRDFVEALASGAPAFALIAHPHYQAKAPVPPEMREEWLADLGGCQGAAG
jgi:hypothetical protein